MFSSHLQTFFLKKRRKVTFVSFVCLDLGNRNPVDADVSPLSPAGGGGGDGGGRLVDVRAVLLAVAAALQGDLCMTGRGGGTPDTK